MASRIDGCGQLASHQPGEALEAQIDHANLDASALVAGGMPRGDTVRRHAAAHHRALVRMWRNDGSDADHAFLFGRFHKQGNGDVRLNVVCADVARGCAAGFEIGGYSVGVALADVQRNGDGLTVMHGSASGGSLRSELAGPHLLDDVVEIGIQVGILGRRDFTFRRKDLDVEYRTWLSGRRRCGSVDLLGMYARTA